MWKLLLLGVYQIKVKLDGAYKPYKWQVKYLMNWSKIIVGVIVIS